MLFKLLAPNMPQQEGQLLTQAVDVEGANTEPYIWTKWLSSFRLPTATLFFDLSHQVVLLLKYSPRWTSLIYKSPPLSRGPPLPCHTVVA